MEEQDNPTTPAVQTAQPDRGQLVQESQLVASLVGSALAVLHESDAGVSLIGEFIGLVAVTGGVGVNIVAAAEPKYTVELAKFFAGRFEDAAHIFRRVEAGEDVQDIMAEREKAEQQAQFEEDHLGVVPEVPGQPDSGGVVLD